MQHFMLRNWNTLGMSTMVTMVTNDVSCACNVRLAMSSTSKQIAVQPEESEADCCGRDGLTIHIGCSEHDGSKIHGPTYTRRYCKD